MQRPRIRKDVAVDRRVVANVHAATDPHWHSGVRGKVPNALHLELVAVAEMENAVLVVREPGMHRHPLNPRLQVRSRLLGVCYPVLRLIAKALEVREASPCDEVRYQR